MKKLLYIIMVIPLVFISCLGKEEVKEDMVNELVFEATVLKIEDDKLTVQPDEKSSEYKSSDTIVISTKNIEDKKTKDLLKVLSVGDLVSIEYNGSIIETYPAKINKVYKIELIE